MRRLLALAVALSACAYYEDRVRDVGAWLAPVDERVIHGDTRCKPDARAAAESGLLRWQSFTRGRVHLSVRWDLDDTNYLEAHPALFCLAPSPATANMGGRTERDVIWWVPEHCSTYKDACIMHEVGHMLGLQHVAVPGQVMSPVNPARVFGAADNRECERVGVCRDRTLGVTTVTVTIDPDIPNVTPEYP